VLESKGKTGEFGRRIGLSGEEAGEIETADAQCCVLET
jgi:hypothetical protein